MITTTTARNEWLQTPCTAFEGSRRIASGELQEVALKSKALLDGDPLTRVLIFNDATSELIEVDFRGTAEDVARKLALRTGAMSPAGAPIQETPAGPGRPKLGVVAREVTLLPRHWDWLNRQPGGASVALRKLVEEARRDHSGKDRLRQAQEVSYRFMSDMAGDWPGFEEASRALFAGNLQRFDEVIEPWPADVRDHLRRLARDSF